MKPETATKYSVTHPAAGLRMTTTFESLAAAASFAAECIRQELASGDAGRAVHITVQSWAE